MAKLRPVSGVRLTETDRRYGTVSKPGISNEYNVHVKIEILSGETRAQVRTGSTKRENSNEFDLCHDDASTWISNLSVRDAEKAIHISHQYGSNSSVFEVEVCYHFGLRLSCLLSVKELEKYCNEVKQEQSISNAQLDCSLFLLPWEIRQRIYRSIIPTDGWNNDIDVSNWQTLVKGLLTNRWCFVPLKNCALLSSCWRIRLEALPLVFELTEFRLNDIDELIQFLIGAGSVGRQHIRCLDFSWVSESDLDLQWQDAPPDDRFYPALPNLHTEECIVLLRQCKNLRNLCLRFDHISIAGASPTLLESDQGLRQLRSLRHITNLSVFDLDGVPLEHQWFVKWLQETPQY